MRQDVQNDQTAADDGLTARRPMKHIGAKLAVALLILLAFWALNLSHRTDSTSAQGATTIGIDADPSGNTATSLGEIDTCRVVHGGDTFDVDIYIKDVSKLLGWEVVFAYDKHVLQVVDKDVQMFQAANQNSNVFDASAAVPDSDGQYNVAAIDIGDKAEDSGSGVLARLKLKAVGFGISQLTLPKIDLDNNGTIDRGPILTDGLGQRIGDVDGDGFFDGPVTNAKIAVDTDCPAATPPPSGSTDGSATPSATPSVLTTVTPAGETPSPNSGTPAPQGSTPGGKTTPSVTGTVITSGGNGDGVPGGGAGNGDSTLLWIGLAVGGAAALLGGAAFGARALRRGSSHER